MRYLILLLCLVGCGQGMGGALTDTTRNTNIIEKLKLKEASDLKGSITFDHPQPTKVSGTASGNGIVNISLGEPGRVKDTKSKDLTTKESVESSFSLDEMVKSVPLVGWILLGVVLIVLIVVVVVALKSTIAGKALDAAVGAGLDLTTDLIDKTRNELVLADPKSDLHTKLNSDLNALNERKQGFLTRQKPNKR